MLRLEEMNYLSHEAFQIMLKLRNKIENVTKLTKSELL